MYSLELLQPPPYLPENDANAQNRLEGQRRGAEAILVGFLSGEKESVLFIPIWFGRTTT